MAEGLKAGRNRLLIQMATGLGKTRVLAGLPTWPPVASWLAQFNANERRVLVVAHRDELLRQAQGALQAANPGATVMIEQGENVASPYADIVVASIQTLSAMKFRRLDRLLARMTFRIVVIDEAHHSPSQTYRNTLARMGFLPPAAQTVGEETEAATWADVVEMEEALKGWDAVCPKDRLLLGVTATPDRTDAIGLSCIFQDLIYQYGIKPAVRDGWLVPPVPFMIETDTSLDAVKTTAGDFNQKQLAGAVNTPARNQLAVKGWQEYAHQRPTLAFTVDVQHAHDLADTFIAAGVKAKAVSGETPQEERREALQQYTRGDLDVLCNAMLFTEGTDLPRTSCILHAKPTKSATLYIQMCGRGLRLFEGKSDCILIDVVDIARKHSLQVAPSLYGLPSGLLGKGETLDQMADAWDELHDQYPSLDDLLGQRLTLAQLRVKALTFDIWSIPDLGAFGAGAKLDWMKVGESIYQLNYPWQEGKETIQVSPDLLGKWEIVCTLQPPDHAPKRQRTIAHGILDVESARMMAESYIEQDRRNVLKLKDKSAAWRGDPPTPKQLATLAKFKVPHNPTITKGQASALLDLAFSRMKGRGR